MPDYRNCLLCAILLFCGISSAQLYPQLHPYESCDLPGGPSIVDIGGLGAGVHARPVQTRTGTRSLPLVAGRRVMFAYPNTDFFANVKVELLPAEHYADEKKLAMDGFDYMLNSGDNARNGHLSATLNGLQAQGLDRSKLEGGVLGVYLLFDDSQHVLTTIYFLNQEPAARKFASMQEYGKLRDSFLSGYTACIRKNRGEQANTP